MIIKLNDLANLADARYGAALEADFLAFALERGSPYKLPATALPEILGWVAGPQAVLSLGADLDALPALEADLEDLAFLVELNYATLPPGGIALPATRGYGLVLTEADLPGRHATLAQARYVELAPTPAATEAQIAEALARLQAALPTDVPLLLRADGPAAPALEALAPGADGLSYGKKDAGAFAQLDYDGFEALVARWRGPIEG